MGTFRSLYVRFPCERCGTDSENEIQFKTDHDGQEQYGPGDRADDVEPGTYEGWGDLYCRACTISQVVAETVSFHQAMARQVELGWLRLEHEGTTLSPQQIVEQGRGYAHARSCLLNSSPCESGFLHYRWNNWIRDLSVTQWHGRPLDHGFIRRMEILANRQMLLDGWLEEYPAFSSDFSVTVDEDHVVDWIDRRGAKASAHDRSVAARFLKLALQDLALAPRQNSDPGSLHQDLTHCATHFVRYCAEEINQTQILCLDSLECALFGALEGADDKDPEKFDKIRWQCVRENAANALTAFGWTVEDPPLPLDDTQWQRIGENPNHGGDAWSPGHAGSISAAGYYAQIQAYILNRA